MMYMFTFLKELQVIHNDIDSRVLLLNQSREENEANSKDVSLRISNYCAC